MKIDVDLNSIMQTVAQNICDSYDNRLLLEPTSPEQVINEIRTVTTAISDEFNEDFKSELLTHVTVEVVRQMSKQGVHIHIEESE